MKNKKDAVFAVFLIALAVICIFLFLLVPALKNKNEANSNNGTAVSKEMSDSISIDKGASEGEETDNQLTSNSVDDTILSNSEVSHSVEIAVETDLEELKAQLPNIIKNGTLADCDVVFIGDSIFTFGDDENDSIPDKVAKLSEIAVYDCSREGIAAGTATNRWVDMVDLASCFAKGENSDGEETSLFNYSLNRYVERDHSGRQLVFVLDCCINDYYQHTELSDGSNNDETFVGSYIHTLSILKENFPDAIIICMVPNDIRHEEYGYNFNNAHYTYNMYKDAIQSVAEEFNVYCLRIDTEDGINRDNLAGLLEDGTHPNGPGRELMAYKIINFIQAILSSVN